MDRYTSALHHVEDMTLRWCNQRAVLLVLSRVDPWVASPSAVTQGDTILFAVGQPLEGPISTPLLCPGSGRQVPKVLGLEGGPNFLFRRSLETVTLTTQRVPTARAQRAVINRIQNRWKMKDRLLSDSRESQSCPSALASLMTLAAVLNAVEQIKKSNDKMVSAYGSGSIRASTTTCTGSEKERSLGAAIQQNTKIVGLVGRTLANAFGNPRT
jgi:hypothetical protein